MIYRYYKCASAKRHEYDRKAIRKDWIEDKVIEEISTWLNNDKLISDMADDVMALLDEGNEMVLALEAQLKEVQSSIDNIVKAIEKGVVTRSTKSRLEELEAEEEKITLNIKLEEAKRPEITKEFIIFTLNKFRNLDLQFEKNKERLIDGLVKAIFVYDDYIKLILTFDDKPINIPTSDEIENMANSSDIQSFVSPKKRTDHLVWSVLFLVTRREKRRGVCKAYAGVRILRVSRREVAHGRHEKNIRGANFSEETR